MRLYIVITICSLLMLFALALGIVDTQLPLYGFEAFRASPVWRGVLLIALTVALPSLAGASLLVGVVGMVYAYVVNSTTALANPQQEPQQLSATHIGELSLSQQEAPTPQQELLLVDDLPTWDIGNIAPVQGNPIPETDLDHDLVQAVMLYAQWGSYAKAATRLGGKITGEGIRQRVISAYQKDPQWVMQVLPSDKLPKV